MKHAPLALLLLLLVPWLLAADSGKPAGNAVTASNLPAREALWPYRVALVEAWQPKAGASPLRAGTAGVLIRVEPSGLARIDFSSDGKYDVPIGKTDLVQNANRIRRGELPKSGPNFTAAIATRLADSAGPNLTGLPPDASASRPGFLCVFADPGSEDFASLAASLVPLRDRHDVMTILFAQGKHPDARMRDRLRALGWTVPFVYDFLSEHYTRSLIADGTPMPSLLLQTNEGRVIFQGKWSPGVVPELTAALDRAFPDPGSRTPEKPTGGSKS